MAYIVPTELPKTCFECHFRVCKFSCPAWTTHFGDINNKEGHYCFLDTQSPKRVMIVDYGDKTKKMEWCPLKKVEEKEDGK